MWAIYRMQCVTWAPVQPLMVTQVGPSPGPHTSVLDGTDGLKGGN